MTAASAIGHRARMIHDVVVATMHIIETRHE